MKNHRILLSILTVSGLWLSAATVDAKTRRRRTKAKALPTVPVPASLTIDEARDTAPRTVTLAVGQATAIRTPSPVRQLVSSIVGSAKSEAGEDEGCVAPVCQMENRRATPGNIVYLTATLPGRSSNLWVETADGTLMMLLRTVAEGSPYTREVQIQTRASGDEITRLRDQASYCEYKLGAALRNLDEAETAAREAAKLAKESRRVGFGEGLTAGRNEAMSLVSTLQVKGGKRLFKNREMQVEVVNQPVRVTTGWWALYRVENRLKDRLRLSASSPAGELSGGERVIAPKGKTLVALYIATETDIAPEVAFAGTVGVIEGGAGGGK